MDFNLSQKNSVFMPGLTSRGAVQNSTSNGMLGALPTVSTPVKFGLIAALLYFGNKKKIALPVLGAAALAIYKFVPTADAATVAAPVTTNITPNFADPNIDPGTLPTMPGIAY